MALISIIKNSRVLDDKRCDAEYFAPEFLVLEKKFQAHPDYCFLGSLMNKSQSCYGILPKSKDYLLPIDNESALRLCRGEDVRSDCLNQNDWVKIPQKYASSRSTMHQGELLILVKGKTIDSEDGVAWISEEIPPSLFNGSVFRVALMDADPRFFYAFFRTSYFTKQKRRLIANATVEYNSIEQIKKYMVICPSTNVQAQVGDIVEKYFEYRRNNRDLFVEAQQILESELGLDKLHFNKPVGYTTLFSEVESSRRLDSEYYFPAFKSFVQNLPKKIIFAPLSKHLTFCQRGKQPFYGDSGLPVINSKHVQPNRVILDDNRRALPGLFSDLKIRTGDILVNGTGRGTLGRVAPYLAAENALPDNHVTILRSSTLDPVFASFYLNSGAGQMQVEMHQRGSSGQLELYPFDIRKFQIWEAPDTVQKEIRKLYDRGAAAEAKSKQLLAEAKARVEQLIEEVVAK
jgi:type I restriction enzyme M protein